MLALAALFVAIASPTQELNLGSTFASSETVDANVAFAASSAGVSAESDFAAEGSYSLAETRKYLSRASVLLAALLHSVTIACNLFAKTDTDLIP